MELIKPQKGTNYNIENDIQNLTNIEQEFEQIDNKITNDISSSIDELKDKVDNDITTAITELDNKVDTEIVTAIDNLETKVNTEISESITALDNKVTTSLQEQAESLKKEISDQIAKVVANSPEDFDTLKEISDWISGHSSDASAMNSAISGNTYAINQEILDRQAADTALQTNINNKVNKDLSNVTGVLPISKGGTGAATTHKLNDVLTEVVYDTESYIADTDLFVVKHTESSGAKSLYAKTVGNLWTYIKDKISSVLGLTSTNYGGTATKATQDGSGNNIVNTYATKSETPKTATFTMTDLGFTKDSTTSVRTFAKTIVSKYGSVGVLRCLWAAANQGYVGSSTNKVLLNGGILVFTAKGSLNNAWDEFTALYTSKVNNKTTLIACSIGSDATEGAESWTVVDYLRKSDLNRITIPTTTDLELDTFGTEALSIGTADGANLGIDTNEIQARNNGGTAPLFINDNGGMVVINDIGSSDGGLRVEEKLIIPIGQPDVLEDGCIWIER